MYGGEFLYSYLFFYLSFHHPLSPAGSGMGFFFFFFFTDWYGSFLRLLCVIVIDDIAYHCYFICLLSFIFPHLILICSCYACGFFLFFSYSLHVSIAWYPIFCLYIPQCFLESVFIMVLLKSFQWSLTFDPFWSIYLWIPTYPQYLIKCK